MNASLLVGGLVAVAAALLSLPLRSPSDALFNTASVVAGVLALSVASGAWRQWAWARPHSLRWFAGGHLLGFIVWVLIAVALEGQLERMISFTVPIAALAFGSLALLTPYVSGAAVAERRLVVLAALLVAVAVGTGLARHGDTESGRLELPPRSSVTLAGQA